MQDRVPLYPGRVKLTPVSGQDNVFDMVRADQPTQLGDPLNKATLLKDATAALFGLGADAVPDDVFKQLGGLADYHVWRKTSRLSEDIPAKYELSELKPRVRMFDFNKGSTAEMEVKYSTSISVDDGGNIKLTGQPQTFKFNPDDMEHAFFHNIKGKFCIIPEELVPWATIYEGCLFIPGGADFSFKSGPGGYLDAVNVNEVISNPLIPAKVVVNYPFSTNRNAYQEGSDAKPATYALRAAQERQLVSATYANASITILHSTTVSVKPDETGVTLDNPATTTISTRPSFDQSSVATIQNAIRGKFITIYSASIEGIKITEPVFIPSDAVVTFTYHDYSGGGGGWFSADKVQAVDVIKSVPPNTIIEYMGQLGNKARIVAGSYTGTGVYGESNPNVLNFEFPPKVVFISAGMLSYSINAPTYGIIINPNIKSNGNIGFTFGYGSNVPLEYTIGARSLYGLFNDRSLTFYGGDEHSQLNVSNTRYSYYAIS